MPQISLTTLAIGALHVVTNRSLLLFPTSAHNHQSWEVIVSLSAYPGPLRPGYRVAFPHGVRWDVWQRVIKPIVEDREYLPSNPAMLAHLQSGSFDTYISILEEAIRRGLVEHGFLPGGPTEEELPTDNPEAGIGEPVSRVDPDIPSYKQYDC